MVKSLLVDARNVDAILPSIKEELGRARLIGLDCETQDSGRHEGLNAYNNNVRLVFDHRRTIMTGFSTYVEGSDTAYYFNLAHADVENRLPANVVHDVVAAFSKDAVVAAHNAPFELVMFRQCHGIDLDNVVCTLQMAVSHHGPDEYDLSTFFKTPLPGAFFKLAREVLDVWADYEPGGRITGAQQELLGKFIAKESSAEHSWNGFVKNIAKGYSLKALTKSRFGVEQTTFKQVLGSAAHMGELTGEQVVAYGADDAYWAVQHYRWMFDDMLKNQPKALNAFFQTENPMVHVYADSWREGIRLDLEKVYDQRDEERKNMAALLRRFKARIKDALPFPADPHEKLLAREKWYAKGWKKKRKQIVDWANSPDSDDDFEQCFQVSNPIGNAWAEEKGRKVSSGKLNIVYYMSMRAIVYDLLRCPVQYSDGSVASDKEARGKIREGLEKDSLAAEIMKDLQEMAEIEQRMKLYLTPYTQLMDPETSRVYPSLSSQLATRRLATSFPNPMQLAKSGSSAYIRGFYLADDDDSVVVSADWSAIELVLIGDQSGDEGFREVYGQLPYGDMHSGAAVDGLAVKWMPGITEEEFREFKFGRNPNNRKLVNFAGVELSPKDFHKFARGTAIGKGINFSYWYSGALSTVAANLGLTDDEHWDMVDRYRARFPRAEAWRVGMQDQARSYGFVELPDGHRRVKFEATRDWAEAMRAKFRELSARPALINYGDVAIRRIQARSCNQVVNAMIQGTCATLAKRSILRLIQLCEDAGVPYGIGGVRLMMPIHDEIVFSVPRRYVMAFIPLLRKAMVEHPDIVTSLPLDCTVAIGRTFRPFDGTGFSQIELDEAQAIEGIIPKELEGSKLSDEKVEELLEWMFANDCHF